MSLVDVEVRGPVATITLVDEARRNALSEEMVSDLLEAFDQVEANSAVRVVVVTNQGHVFCAGANLSERSSTAPSSDDRGSQLTDLFWRVQKSAKPFVGRLAGHCVAGGVGLAAVFDVSIAIETASFGFSEVRIGVAPAIISVVCLQKLRRADAQSAMLRGQRFLAPEAARMGLITASVPADELDTTVTAVVNDLLAGEPHAIAATKELVRVVPTLEVDAAYAWTAQVSRDLFLSEPAHEGMTAFLEKRPARWVESVESI